MNCLIYIRVSSDEQVKNYSLATQKEICEKYATDKGYKVIKVFSEEGESAKTADRPKLIELLDYCRKNKKKIHLVLVYRFDRVARSTFDHLAIKTKLAKYGIKLESASEPIDDSPTGRFLETLLASMAQLDNEVRAEKTRNGVYKRFKMGLSHGVPLGYLNGVKDGKSVPIKDPETFDLVKKAWALMSTGTKSLTEMAKVMNDWGLQITYHKQKKPITKQFLSKMFNNKYYCGWLVSKVYKEEVKGVHPPMITEEMFYKVQAILTGNNRIPLWVKRNRVSLFFPLRGILKCSKCGKNLVSGNVQGKYKKYAKYWCKNSCIHSINSHEVEDLLKERLSNIQPNQDLVALYTLMLQTTYKKTKKELLKRKENSEKMIKEQKELLKVLTRGNMTGKYSDEIYEEEKATIEDKILAYQITANDDLYNNYDIERTVNFIKALFIDLAKAYEVSEYGQKRILISSIYPSGLVFDGKELLNSKISPAFRSIKDFADDGVAVSALEFTQFELFLASFQQLLQAYPKFNQQFSYA